MTLSFRKVEKYFSKKKQKMSSMFLPFLSLIVSFSIIVLFSASQAPDYYNHKGRLYTLHTIKVFKKSFKINIINK
jgi:hypothetical protein